MPDPTTPSAFTPPDPNALAERQKRMDALLKQTKAAPAPAPAAAPTAQPATTQPSLQVPAQAISAQATPAPAVPVGADRSLGEMMVRQRAPQVQAIPTPETMQAQQRERVDAAVPRQEFDPLGLKAAERRATEAVGAPIVGAVQDATDAAVRAGVAPSRFASETVRIGIEQAAQTQAGLNKRVDDYLRTRGYDEPVSLVGDKIDLPGTVQRMEASALTKKAQEAGYPDWFAVPPGPEADQIRQQVQEKVASDLRHAAAVGKGAIFIDPNPAKTDEWLSKLPVTWAVTAAALLPHAQATLTPQGYQLKTEAPVMSALRVVGAPVTAWASMRKAAADSGFIDKVGEAHEISAREFEAYAQGNTELGDQLHQEWSEKRSEAINDAIAAATGGKDWKDIFLDAGMPGVGQDPETVKSLVQVVRTDPMSMQVNDELADDIERVFKPSPYVMDAIRGTLWLEGAAEDVGGPDLVTPALAGAGAAARWGARLEGSATDLTRGAAAIRDAANAGADVRAVIEAADGAYQGMGEALKLRIAARARVQPSVVAQVRNLETHAKEMAAKVTAAEQRLADAREATDVAAAGRDLAQTRLDAARAQTELATAYRSFTQEQLDVWNAYGADNIKHAEALMEEVDNVRRQARAEEANLTAATSRNGPRVAQMNEANELVRDAAEKLEEARNATTDAAKLVADAKAKTKAARTAKDKAAVEAAMADQKFAEQVLAKAKEEQRQAQAALKGAGEKHAVVMKDVGPFIQEQMTLTDRVARLHARAAQLETEAGWRVLSVADDGRAADAALENGHGLLRDAGLMPDINPLDAKSTREMIERGKLWGEGLREANEEAGRRLGAAMQDYRKANSMLRGASRETQEAAEAALNRLRKLGETQYGRELAEGRARAWREEALAMADDIDRGVVELKKRPKDTSERAVNILDGAIVGTAKDGTRTLDTAAFRAKMEEQFTRDGVAWWLRHAGDDATLWRQALGFEPRQGNWSYQGLQRLQVSPGEALVLQQGQRGLLEGLRRTSGDAAAVNQVEALLALRRDPLNIGASFMDTTPRKFVQGIADQYEHWKRMLDPMVAKVGDADESVIRVSKMAANRAAIMRDELLMIGRLARAPMGWRGFVRSTKNWGGSKEIVAALIRYMDSTEAMEVFGRATIGNRGPEALWSKARRQILNSSSLDESAAVARKAAIDAADGEFLARWDIIESRAKATEGDIANKPLLGLSRVWWPPGEQMNARASAALWGAAIDELRRHDTFEGFMEAMKGRTSNITGGEHGPGPVEHIPDRAYGFGARNAAQAAVQADVGDMMVREIGGLINAEEAADFNRVITGNADQTVSMSRAWETAGRLGSPITQTATRDSARAVAQQQEIVRLATTRSGEDVFALTTQVRALDDTLDKVVKETFARNAASRNIGESTFFSHALDMQQWWKSSVTIGLIVANPRYFINNLFGNISQVWLTQGLGTAARMTFQNAPSVIPVVGRYFDAAMRATSEAASDVPVLGSMLNALINPHINKFMAGQQGTFRAANGIVYDLDTVRQWAADDGVLTSFMQEEYGRLFARSRGNSTLTRFRYLQDDLYAWANEIEIRQRTALYLDLLRQGYTRSAARERTLRALYDWHGALTPFESSYITTLSTFYRFIKLGYKQAWYEAISKPLLKPGEATAEALRGSSGLARMRNQGMLLRLPELQDDGQYQDEADKFDAMAQYRNLDYLNKRISWTERNDPNQIAMYQGGRGQFMPYSTIALPALTAIDMGNLVTLTMYALPAGAMSVGGALGLTDERWTSPDVMQPYWDEASNLAGPIAAPFIATAAQKAGYDSPTQQEIVRLKPGEAAMAQFFGWAVGLGAEKALDYNEHQRRALQDKLDPTQVGKDYQSTVASAGTAALVRGFPGVMQAPQWLDAFGYENPAAKELLRDGQTAAEVADYLSWGSGQVTNFMRSFPNDPNNNLTQRQSKFAEELKGRADYQEGEEREKQSTPP